jgi:predicted Rossmann fold flavoprotein
VVVASGGLSIPKIGASDFGYRVARQFGVPLVASRPALVPLTFDRSHWAPFAALAGLALEVEIATGNGHGRARFVEDLLFTHRGLSGPAILQISTFWRSGEPIVLDLAPGLDMAGALLMAKRTSRRKLANELAGLLPRRLADTWLAPHPGWADKPVAEVPDRELRQLAATLERWSVTPSGTEGYRKAEVTAGGVDTRALNSQSMQCLHQRGLYFIGEVVDVTGWLGGYNFQWAWASAAACARALEPRPAATG